MGEQTTRVSYASNEQSTSCTVTQGKIPILTHTYSLQRGTRRPTSLYAKSNGGGTGTRVSYASSETLHGVDSNTTQNTNPDTHLQAAAPDTTTHIIICKKHTCTWGNGTHACELRFNRITSRRGQQHKKKYQP